MSFARTELNRFARFATVGVATNGMLYIAFLALLRAGTAPVSAAGLCYVAGTLLSYVLNRRWTFASGQSHRRDLPRFLVAYGIGLVSTLATIALLTRWLRPAIAQILNIGLTALVIYFSLRLLHFGRKKEKSADAA